MIVSVIVPCWILFAQQAQLPKNYPPGLYDESKVPHYTLPDPLIFANGDKVTDVKTWNQKRRPEILSLFEIHVYGRTMVHRPKEMIWEVVSENRRGTDSTGITKVVRIYFTGEKIGPKMDLIITLPAEGEKPAPIFLIPGWLRDPRIVLGRGYGVVTFNPWDIEPDRKDSAYIKSIRKVFA